MTRAALLVVVCGCNRIFGVGGNLELPDIDAKQFDARPPMCPDPLTPPPFEASYHQLPIFGCNSYTPTDAGFATAVCSSMSAVPTPSLVVGTDVTPLALTPKPYFVASLRPDPEGDQLVMAAQDSFGMPVLLMIYTPTTMDHVSWSRLATIPIPQSNNFVEISTPSRGPEHHLVIGKQSSMTGAYEVVELVGSGDTWTPQYTVPAGDLGVIRVSHDPALTPDGLRMVFYAESSAAPAGAVHYTGRARITDHFGPATPILGVIANDVLDPYLTEDCARIYFGALTTTIYLEQPPLP